MLYQNWVSYTLIKLQSLLSIKVTFMQYDIHSEGLSCTRPVHCKWHKSLHPGVAGNQAPGESNLPALKATNVERPGGKASFVTMLLISRSGLRQHTGSSFCNVSMFMPSRQLGASNGSLRTRFLHCYQMEQRMNVNEQWVSGKKKLVPVTKYCHRKKGTPITKKKKLLE